MFDTMQTQTNTFEEAQLELTEAATREVKAAGLGRVSVYKHLDKTACRECVSVYKHLDKTATRDCCVECMEFRL